MNILSKTQFTKRFLDTRLLELKRDNVRIHRRSTTAFAKYVEWLIDTEYEKYVAHAKQYHVIH